MNNKTCQIEFPWSGELDSLESCEFVTLRDIEVVGVGIRRRHRILKLHQIKKICLVTHQMQIPIEIREIYQHELLETLQWLQPEKVEVDGKIDIPVELNKAFHRIFPQTEKMLGALAGRICDAYMKELNWTTMHLEDHWCYFVGFLRQRFPQNRKMLEVAHWEWSQAWIDFLGASKTEENSLTSNEGNKSQIIILNPTLQIAALTSDNEILQKQKGLYAIFYNYATDTNVSLKLVETSAVLIDLLQDDFRFTEEQLCEAAAGNFNLLLGLTTEQWKEIIEMMKSEGIFIIESH
jgi:hypothetical protein